jgi:hypothetical protein
MIDLGDQKAMVATPEKALLDLVYLQPDSASADYLQGLRLQNTERIDLGLLNKLAAIFDSPKIRKAVNIITRILHGETREYEEL